MPDPFPRPAVRPIACGSTSVPLGIKRSSAQITNHYAPETLVGRQVIAVVNFPPKQIGSFVSEVLVLGVYDDAGAVVLLQPERPVGPGQKIG